MTRRGNVLVAITTVLLIVVVTLVPQASVHMEPALACVVCGSRGVADAVLNLLLFFPLGASLAPFYRPRLVLLGAALTSCVIEFSQLYLTGRKSQLIAHSS